MLLCVITVRQHSSIAILVIAFLVIAILVIAILVRYAWKTPDQPPLTQYIQLTEYIQCWLEGVNPGCVSEGYEEA